MNPTPAWSTLSQNQIMVLAGAFIVLMLTAIAHRRRRRESPLRLRTSVGEPAATVQEEQALRSDLDAVLRQLQDFAHRTEAQLDAKCLHLQRLLDDADRRTEGLSLLLDQISERGYLAATSNGPSSTDQHLRPPGSVFPRQAILDLLHSGRSAPEVATATGRPLGEVELAASMLDAD